MTMRPRHALSKDDSSFVQEFESCRMTPGAFHHREHVRLAYAYLCDGDVLEAHRRLRGALQSFLAHHGVDASKYHETMTQAWILAVDHFMEQSAPAPSSAAFLEANPALLDSGIMLTHYSKEALFSDEARARFVEPDLDPIPRRR